MAQQLARTGMTGVKNTTGLDEEAQVDIASIIADVVTQNYPSAAAGAVSLYGDMTNNDALSDTADAAGTVMGVGGLIKGIGKQAIKSGAKEIAKEGAKEAAKGAAKEVGKTATKELVSGAGQAAAREAVSGALKPVAMDAATTAAKQSGQEVFKSAIDGIVKDQSKTSLKSVLDTVLGEGGAGAKFENGMGKLQTGMSMADALSPPPATPPGPSGTPGGFTPTATALRQILAQQGIRPNPFTAQFGGF